MKRTIEKAMFGAGCFWGIEESFRKLRGVLKTEVGYSGGHAKNPKYEQVCTDLTGHAEVVKIKFDPNIIDYNQLLDKFWEIHDPTQLNKQGPDIGSQYRSAIFYFNKSQLNASIKSKAEHQKKLKNKIVTEILPASEFYKAEEYHQKYLMKKGLSECHI